MSACRPEAKSRVAASGVRFIKFGRERKGEAVGWIEGTAPREALASVRGFALT